MDESTAVEEPKLRAPRDPGYRDWRGVVTRMLYGIGTRNISPVAAGCAFCASLAIVPSLTALVVFYGLIADPVQVQEQVAAARVISAEVREVVGSELTEVAGASATGVTWGFAITLGLALWYTSAAVKSLVLALNSALEADEQRNLIMVNLVGLAVIVLCCGAALAAIIGLIASIGFSL